jgi:protein-disulfide isomerase
MGIGARIGVESTPTTFINGRLVSGAQPYEVFAAIIDEELERASTK